MNLRCWSWNLGCSSPRVEIDAMKYSSKARIDVFQLVLICYSHFVLRAVVTEAVAYPEYVVKLYNSGCSYECTCFNLE